MTGKQKMGVWLFGATSVICSFAALVPAFKGGEPNSVFLGVGAVFLVIAIASAKRKP